MLIQKIIILKYYWDTLIIIGLKHFYPEFNKKN